MIQERIDLKISDTVMTSQERNKFRARRSKRMQSLKHSFKKVPVSHAQLAHFSTLAKEKHMLLILNFSTLTFIPSTLSLRSGFPPANISTKAVAVLLAECATQVAPHFLLCGDFNAKVGGLCEVSHAHGGLLMAQPCPATGPSL